MPSLKETLMDDLKVAMREKDNVRKDVVQLVRAGILQIEKDEKVVLDDAGVTDVVAKELKKRRDVLPDYIKSGVLESIQKIEQEIEILLGYLPKQLGQDEIKAIVVQAIQESGATSIKEIGKVMALVMPKTKGKADGKLVNDIVRGSF